MYNTAIPFKIFLLYLIDHFHLIIRSFTEPLQLTVFKWYSWQIDIFFIQMDSWVLTSTNDFKPTVSLTRGKSRDLPNVMSPPFQRKWTPSSPTPYRSPHASPSLGRDKRSDSCKENCKENFDYEESLALAMALSRSIYQSPLPVIPGLSHVKSTHDVLAHPHTNVRISYFHHG